MFSFTLRIITVFALALGFASLTAAQEAKTPTPTAAQDNHVTHTSFKSRVFEIKNRDPFSIVSVIKLLTSGHKGALASADGNFKTITVRDFPENLASIEEALKRLDTPEAPRPEVELRMHVLIASNAAGSANQFPADLKDVIGQLESTLNFKSYQLLTSIIQRTKERITLDPSYIRGEGSAQANLPGVNVPLDFRYNFQASSLKLSPNPSGATTVQLEGFYFGIEGEGGRAVVRSDVSVRDGEKVVVGTAGLKDKALILVLTAKLLK
jgi:hypothetical protein